MFVCVCVCTHQSDEKGSVCVRVCFQLGVCATVDPSSAHSIIFFLPAATGISVFFFFSPLQKKKKHPIHLRGNVTIEVKLGFFCKGKKKKKIIFRA